jgi:hypothetical protein
MVATFATLHNITVMRNKKQINWTVEECTVLFEYAEEKGPAFCLQVLHAKGFTHRTESSVTQKCKQAGLRYKGPKLGCYKKGAIPSNKGKTMPDWVRQKSCHSWFKKGSGSHNEVPIGHESRRTDGYTWVKIAEGHWEQKHRLIYKQEIGPIPEKHIVVFRDGNPFNFSPDNLEAITKKELVRRNRWGSGPSEYSLISGRAAASRLNKRGFGDRVIRHNPELLEIAKAETLLKLQQRKRHDRT